MKNLLLSVCIVIASLSFSFAQFEGEVTLSMSNTDNQINFVLKGKKVKMTMVDDEEGNKPSMYIDGNTSDFVITTEEEGEVSAIKINMAPGSMMGTMMNSAVATQSDENPFNGAKFERTNTIKEVNDRKCRLIKGSSEDGSFDAWVAEDLNLSFADLFPVNGPAIDKIKGSVLVTGIEGFIMRIDGVNKEGEKITINNIVKERTVSSKEINLPSGVEAVDMEAMIQQMQTGQGNPLEFQQMIDKFKKASQDY